MLDTEGLKALLLGAFLLSVFLFSFLILHWNKRKGCVGKVVPGWTRPPADPKMGDLGKALSVGSLQDFLLQQHEGGRRPVVAFWWKKEHVVSVCSQQAFKETEGLCNRPNAIFDAASCPLHGYNSIQSINGCQWKERKKCLHGTVRGLNLESFIADFAEIAHGVITTWLPGQGVHLRDMFRMTLKGILETSLGSYTLSDDSAAEKLAEVEKLVELYDVCKCETDKYLLLDVPPPDSQTQFQEKVKQLQDCMKKILNSRKTQKKRLPLLDALLESGYPEDEIVSHMLTFLGGFHTSGYYAMWVLYYLAKYPHVQDKLFAEMEKMVDRDTKDKLRAYTFSSSTYLRQVLDEVLRVSSTAGFTGHYSDQDSVVEGYHVPSHTPIIQAIEVAMQNRAVWENPQLFEPDRFAPGSKHGNRGHEFRPFGISLHRHCPANQFTYTMISVYMTILVQHFILIPDKKELGKIHGIATGPDDAEVHIQFRKP